MAVADKNWRNARSWLCLTCALGASAAHAQAPAKPAPAQQQVAPANTKDTGAAPSSTAHGKRHKQSSSAAQSGAATASAQTLKQPADDAMAPIAPAKPSAPTSALAPAKPKAPALAPAAPAKPAAPACSLTDPEQPRGGRLEITAEHFSSVPVVRINGKPARMLERRETRVSIQIPADSDGGPITVLQDGRNLDCGNLIIIGKNR